MDVIERLKKTREILTPEGAWTKGAYAAAKPIQDLKLAFGSSVALDSPDAKCFCLHGAFAKAGGLTAVDLGPYSHWELDMLIAPCVPASFQQTLVDGRLTCSGSLFNDDPTTTQAEVLAALDCAIAKLEAK